MLELLGFLLPLAAVVLLGFFLHRCFAVEAAFTPLVANGCVLLFMLVLGCLGWLQPARLAAYLIMLLLGGYAIGKAPKEFFRYLFSPGVFAFLAGSVVLTGIYLVHGSFYGSWDEFSHWGQAFKLIYENDAVYQLTQYNNLVHATYPQGMSFLYYFYALLSPAFSEAATFAVIGITLCSAAATLLAKLSWKQPVVSVLAIASVPLFFVLFPYSYPYICVYQDTLLGALFGALLVMVVFTKQYSAGHTFGVAVVAASLQHIKPLGLMLAIFATLFYAIMLWNKPKRILGKWILHVGSVVGAIALSYGYWHLFLQMTGFTQDKFSNPLGRNFVGSVTQAIQGKNEFVASVFEQFMINFKHLPVVYNGYGTPLVIFGLLTAFGIGGGLYLWEKKKERGPAIVLWGMPLVFMAFLFGLFYTYVCMMSSQEALLNNSYQRYVSSVMIGWCMVALAVVLFYSDGIIKKIPGLIPVVCFGVVLALVVNTTLQHDVLDLKNSRDKAGRTGFDEVSGQMSQVLQPGEDVWLVAQGADAIYNFMYAYTLMPARVSPSLPFTWIPEENSPEKIEQMAMDNGVEYILVYIIDEGFIQTYGFLFSDGLEWVEQESLPVLYKVVEQDGQVRFELAVATQL